MHVRAFLVSAAVALVASAGLSSAASAAEPCTHLTGEAFVGEKTEKQKINDSLSTDLNEKQKLSFFWEGGKQRFRMQALLHAACHSNSRGAVFSGRALGTLNKEPGYTMSFSIKISAEGVVTMKAKVKLRAEVIEEFETEFAESTEEIS